MTETTDATAATTGMEHQSRRNKRSRADQGKMPMQRKVAIRDKGVMMMWVTRVMMNEMMGWSQQSTTSKTSKKREPHRWKRRHKARQGKEGWQQGRINRVHWVRPRKDDRMKRKRRGRCWATAIPDGMNNDDGREWWKNLEQRGRSKVEKQHKGRTEKDCIRYCKSRKQLEQASSSSQKKRTVVETWHRVVDEKQSATYIGGKHANKTVKKQQISVHHSMINWTTRSGKRRQQKVRRKKRKDETNHRRRTKIVAHHFTLISRILELTHQFQLISNVKRSHMKR